MDAVGPAALLKALKARWGFQTSEDNFVVMCEVRCFVWH